MSWYDKLASTPSLGVRLNNIFIPSGCLLSSISPELNTFIKGEKQLFEIERQDPFSVQLITEDGFQYGIESSRVFCGYKHRLRLRSQSGDLPKVDMLSQPKPYTNMLTDIEVRLKAKDPIEEDRKITLGDRLWAGGKGSISLNRFHTEYQGLTQDESNKEIAKMLADQITIYNPDVAAVMGMVAAEETGMADWLEKAKSRRQELEKQPGLREPNPKTTQERIRGEVRSPTGMEEAAPRGARQPPANYTRGR